MRRDGGGSYTMLARAGLGDDARLAHFHREQPLAHGVINLVRARVIQILALEVNAWAAKMCRETRCKLQRRGAPDEILQQVLKLGLKRGVGFRQFIGALQLEERHHQRPRDVAAAVGTEAPWHRRWRLQNGAHTCFDSSAGASSWLSARRTS